MSGKAKREYLQEKRNAILLLRNLKREKFSMSFVKIVRITGTMRSE